MSRRAWALFAVMCVLWGVPYLLIKVAVGHMTPATLVFLRTSLGAVVLLPVAAHWGHLRGLARRWRPLVLYTAVELAVPWFLLSTAERRLSSSLSGLLVAAVPLVGAAASRLSGDRAAFAPRHVPGAALGMAGVAALVGLDVRGADAGSLAAMAVVVVGYAVGPIILSRRLADLPATGVVSASLALCALGYAPAGAVQLVGADVTPAAWGCMAVLGVACTAVAFVVFFALIGEIGPVRATVITYVNPAVAVALGTAVLGERLTFGMAVGFPLVLAGSYLATRPGPGGTAAPAVETGPAVGIS